MATESVESQRRRRGAGRNLPAAIGVSVVLGGLVLGTLFTYRFGFVVLLVLVISGAVWELVRALGRAGIHPPLVPLLAGVLAIDLLAWFRGGGALTVAFLLTALGCLVWRLAEGPAGYLRDVSAAVFVAMYVPFLAGYAAGVLLGRHPMAPTVSPAKSWEGFGGSTIACVAAGIVFLVAFFDAAWWQGALFGLAIVVTATLGDLVESMIKRDLGIKDMGTILPGHGGIMDRLDSLLPAAAVSWLLLSAFAPVG